MKISRDALDEAEALRLRSQQQQIAQRQTPEARTEGGGSEKSESVTISALAREIEAIDVPSEDAVRADKVRDIRDRIANGTYKVDSEEVAKKVIEDLLF